MSDAYFETHRTLHDRFDTRVLANRMEEALCTDTISAHVREFIGLATCSSVHR